MSFQALKLIVLTGGPGAGKTAVLEMVLKSFCSHVAVVPEAASIIFGGGFFRRDSLPAIKGAQRAIFQVQKQLERITLEEGKASVAICDRGGFDGLAYWPGQEEEFWLENYSSRKKELARYHAVIHMKTPEVAQGYNHENPVRNETLKEALALDQKLLEVWKEHPNRHIIESQKDFLTKAQEAIKAIQFYLPHCCEQNNLA